MTERDAWMMVSGDELTRNAGLLRFAVNKCQPPYQFLNVLKFVFFFQR